VKVSFTPPSALGGHQPCKGSVGAPTPRSGNPAAIRPNAGESTKGGTHTRCWSRARGRPGSRRCHQRRRQGIEKEPGNQAHPTAAVEYDSPKRRTSE
jgi:hypothetical protein